jgi:hypothetical protein
VAGIYTTRASATTQKAKGKAVERGVKKPVEDKRFRAAKAVAQREKDYPTIKAPRTGQYEKLADDLEYVGEESSRKTGATKDSQ